MAIIPATVSSTTRSGSTGLTGDWATSAISDQCANVITVWANKGKDQEGREGEPDALVTIEKQRNGSFEGRFKLWFDQRSLRFCDSPNSPVTPYL